MLSLHDKLEAGQKNPLAGPPHQADTVRPRPEVELAGGEEEYLQGEEAEEEVHLEHLAKVQLLIHQRLQGLAIDA